MKILPAIDLMDGRCVRLYQGEFGTAHRVAQDAVETARGFLLAGAGMIHMVDLDGALGGVRKNGAVIERVIRETGAAVELGGGIRTMDDLKAVFSFGVSRAVIGSAALENPRFVEEAAGRYGERIAVGIDARDGRVRTGGWTRDSGVGYLSFAQEMERLGAGAIIFTDIETDGMLCGPNIEALKALKKGISCRVTASGGVSCLADIRALAEAGIDEVIVGKALYCGAINLKDAIELGGATC